MNLPPLPLKDNCLFVDNSFLEALTTCPRKLQYTYLLKRRPVLEKPSLNLGSAIHDALEYRYKHFKNNSTSVLDEQEIFEKVLSPFFAQNPEPEGDHRNLQFAHEVLKRYLQRYSVEPFKLLTKEGEVQAELTFALPLFVHESTAIMYCGRIDLPVIWDDQVIIIDHKTASSLGQYYFDGQRVSSQYEGYCWAFEQTAKLPVTGYCINAIRTKEMPGKPRGSWDDWWMEGFQRHKEYLRPGQLEEWKKNTIALVKEFFYHFQQDFMPQKKKACTMYGKCPYYDVCYLREPQREVVLASDSFEDNNWSPLKQTNEE